MVAGPDTQFLLNKWQSILVLLYIFIFKQCNYKELWTSNAAIFSRTVSMFCLIYTEQ